MNYEYTEIKISQYKSLTEFWESIDEIELTIGDSKESLKNYLKKNPGLSYRCIIKRKRKSSAQYYADTTEDADIYIILL